MMAISIDETIKLSTWQWLLRHRRASRDRCVVCGELACFYASIQGEGKDFDTWNPGKLPVCPGHLPPFFDDPITYKKGVNKKIFDKTIPKWLIMENGEKITIYEGRKYLIDYCNSPAGYLNRYAELDGKDVIPFCKKIDDDRNVQDVWIYEITEIPIDTEIDENDTETRYCMTYWFESQRHPPDAWQAYQLMLGQFVPTLLKRWLHEPGASKVRLLKLTLIDHASINWFFRDLAKVFEREGGLPLKKVMT